MYRAYVPLVLTINAALLIVSKPIYIELASVVYLHTRRCYHYRNRKWNILLKFLKSGDVMMLAKRSSARKHCLL